MQIISQEFADLDYSTVHQQTYEPVAGDIVVDTKVIKPLLNYYFDSLKAGGPHSAFSKEMKRRTNADVILFLQYLNDEGRAYAYAIKQQVIFRFHDPDQALLAKLSMSADWFILPKSR